MDELKSRGAVEREIKAGQNGKYTSGPEYRASERATRKAITNIFRAVADFGTCDDVLTLIGGKDYRRAAFINYLQHENYISPIVKACYT